MGTLITLWLVVAGGYYLCIAGLRLAWKLPAIAVFIVCLPAMPFVVAYRNRKEHPVQAKIIYWGWGAAYLILLLSCFTG
ncbi:MAG: hypothetical protein LIP00_04035 [Parabacteroides sp.]|nr:hypothetical protein [Parabacteroides sp.]